MATSTSQVTHQGCFILIILCIPLNEIFAQTTYQSTPNHVGFWNSSSSWIGSTIPSTNLNNDDVFISGSSRITRNGNLAVGNGVLIDIASTGQLTIEGNLDVQNGLDLDIDGRLIIDGGLSIQNGGNINLSGTGFLQVAGPVTMDQNSLFDINGSVDFNSDVTLGQNADIFLNQFGSMDIEGELNIGDNADVLINGIMDVSGSVNFGNNAEVVVNGLLAIGQNLTFSNPLVQFTGTGTVNIGGTSCAGWTGVGTCNDLLPVILLYFKAEKVQNSVALNWRTATELNNDYFTIEKSQGGINYISIGQTGGSGTTSESTEYEFIDRRPSLGTTYYRLKQTDFDGTTEIFRPVSVYYDGSQNEVVLYPNPVTQNELNISISDFQGNIDVAIRISDLNGRVVYSNFTKTNELGLSDNKLDLTFMPKGSYVVNLSDNHYSEFFKIIKN